MTPEEFRRATAPGLVPQSGAGSGNNGSSESSGGWGNPFGSGTTKRTPIFVPEADGGLGGYRVKDDSGNWAFPNSGEMSQNGINYSDAGEQTKAKRNQLKDAAQRKASEEEARRIAGADNKKYELLREQVIQSGKATDAQIASIKQQGDTAVGQLKLLADKLGIEDGNSDAERVQRGDQFNATMRQQTRQMELGNDLLKEKLRVEDRHFQQQMSLDERNARRTKVLGSLTLIAQSLKGL